MTARAIGQFSDILLLTFLLLLGLVGCRPQEKAIGNLNSSLVDIFPITASSVETTSSLTSKPINQLPSSNATTTTTAQAALQLQATLSSESNNETISGDETGNASANVTTVQAAPVLTLPKPSNRSLSINSNVDVASNSTAQELREPMPKSGVSPVDRKVTTSASASNTTASSEDDEHWEFDEHGFRRCNAANNHALNKCLRLIIHDLRPRLKTGIPELNLPSIDPLHLKSVTFEHESGPIKIVATFRKVIAMGLSYLNKTVFEVDMKRRILEYDLEIPNMQIIGEYELSGNLFFFPVGGKGNFAVNLQRITAKGQGRLGIVILNDRKTVQMNKIDIDLDIANVKVHLTNLFNGDQVFGQIINKFLNDNSKDIFDEIKPKIAMQVSELLKSASNRALALLGADHFTDVRNAKVDTV